MQYTEGQEAIQQWIVVLTTRVVTELGSTDFGFHVALSSLR